MTAPERQLNQPRVIGTAIVIGSLLLLYWLVMPVVVGSLADARGLRDDQIGWLASSYSAGICLATFASIIWIRKVSWRFLVRLGSAGVAAGFALVIYAESFPLLVAGHVIASLFSGIAYAVIMALLGDSLHPARNYALVFFVQVALGMAATSAIPAVAEAANTLPVAAGTMIALGLLCFYLARWLPQQGSKSGKITTCRIRKAKAGVAPLALALVAIVLVFTGDSGIWVFLERIGAEGHDRAFGANLVSINLASGAIGSLSAAWLAERWGFLWPMIIAIVLSLVSLNLFTMDNHRSALIAASFVNGWAWNFGAAYRMALVAKLDTSGRYTVLIPSMQTLGNTIGPAMTGLLLTTGGYTLAFGTIAGLWVMALMCYFFGWLGLRSINDVEAEHRQPV